MATYYVRKNGSGTHTTIQSAIYDATTGDVIDIEAGTFNENVDLYKGITLQGAGKENTTIVGSLKTNVVISGTWALNSTTLNFPSGTVGFEKGRVITGTGIPANARIASVSSNSITISAPTTSARTSLTAATMQQNNDASIRVRGSGAVIRDVKVVGFDSSTPSNETAAVFFRNTGLGTNFAQNFLMHDCHLVADGEYAILADSGASVGNGTVRNCLITGKTFTGSNPATGNQFSVPNVPRQLVVFQSVNLPITFKDNVIKGITGGLTVDGVASYNSAITCDAANSVVTNNLIDGTHGYGYALRVRNATSTVQNNVNKAIGVNANSGYLIGATGAQVSGMDVGTNISITVGLTTPSQASAGSPMSVSMSKNVLKTNSVVSADPVFSDETNWNLVSFVWKHTGSAKRIVSSFKDFASAKTVNLKSGMNSGDQYELVKVIISKADRTLKVIKRSQIEDVSSFDFTLK
jgi:hypothetical protein